MGRNRHWIIIIDDLESESKIAIGFKFSNPEFRNGPDVHKLKIGT